MDPGFSYIIQWQAILEVKQYVEKHSLCRWLGNLKSEDGKRAKARRYRDGAVKIMDLLRPQLTPHDIMHYERLYERLQELPEYWSSERIVAAKKLWNYVLSVDEKLSHERILSIPNEKQAGSWPYAHDYERYRAHEYPHHVQWHVHSPRRDTERNRRKVRFSDGLPPTHPPTPAARSAFPYYEPLRQWQGYTDGFHQQRRVDNHYAPNWPRYIV
ncbi:hypothetical protein C2E23DRAFT_755626 [Lenzites betulinus]|nr:hypothetical protein C2E23DRAFT_755626 [Lenzites betulinus]